MFWKLVRVSASTVRRPTVEGEGSFKDTFLVVMHRLLDVDLKNKTLLVSVDADNREAENGSLMPLVFSPAVLSVGQLNTMKVWQTQGVEEYRLQDESGFFAAERGALPAVLQRIVLGASGKASSSSQARLEAGVREKLSQKGFLEGQSWELT